MGVFFLPTKGYCIASVYQALTGKMYYKAQAMLATCSVFGRAEGYISNANAKGNSGLQRIQKVLWTWTVGSTVLTKEEKVFPRDGTYKLHQEG